MSGPTVTILLPAEECIDAVELIGTLLVIDRASD
jgi:hypothetical protein